MKNDEEEVNKQTNKQTHEVLSPKLNTTFYTLIFFKSLSLTLWNWASSTDEHTLPSRFILLLMLPVFILLISVIQMQFIKDLPLNNKHLCVWWNVPLGFNCDWMQYLFIYLFLPLAQFFFYMNPNKSFTFNLCLKCALYVFFQVVPSCFFSTLAGFHLLLSI